VGSCSGPCTILTVLCFFSFKQAIVENLARDRQTVDRLGDFLCLECGGSHSRNGTQTGGSGDQTAFLRISQSDCWGGARRADLGSPGLSDAADGARKGVNTELRLGGASEKETKPRRSVGTGICDKKRSAKPTSGETGAGRCTPTNEIGPVVEWNGGISEGFNRCQKAKQVLVEAERFPSTCTTSATECGHRNKRRICYITA